MFIRSYSLSEDHYAEYALLYPNMVSSFSPSRYSFNDVKQEYVFLFYLLFGTDSNPYCRLMRQISHFHTWIFLLCFIPTALTMKSQTADSVAVYTDEGERYFGEGKFVEAGTSFSRAVKLAQDRPSDLAELYNNLGNVEGYLGNPEKALEYFQKALRMADRSHSPEISKCEIHKDISSIYSDLKDFPSALKHLAEAEMIARRSSRADLLADCLNNKGVIYEQLDSMLLALQFYEEAKQEYLKKDIPERLSMIHINIGVVNKALERYNEALTAYDEALRQARKIPSDFYIAVIQNNRGNVLSLLGRHHEAIEGTKEALRIARTIGQTDLVQNCYESLADQYAASGDYKSALRWQKSYTALHDSVINVERVQALADMETKYDVEVKDLELGKLAAENSLKDERNARNVLWIFVLAVLVCSIAGGAFLWNRYTVAKQKRKELEIIAETEQQERERIAKDMHDELGSGISSIHWITANALRNSPDQAFQKIEDITHDLAHNMRGLIWLLNVRELSWKEFCHRIRESGNNLFEDSPVEFIFRADEEKDFLLNAETVRNLFLILKEAMHNVLKHSGATQCGITIHTNAETLEIRVSDNGRGFDETGQTPGHGLRNMRSRANVIGARVSFDRVNEGSCARVVVPYRRS